MNTAGFTRKKVESMTLGEKLKKIRSEYRISLNEVSKQTKIRMKYLELLENGEYEKLPADVYVRGFVRSYAHFLGADDAALVRMYEQERHIQKNLKKEYFQENFENNFSLPRFVITPKWVVIAVVTAMLCGGFVYLYREFQSYASTPRLMIEEPLDGTTINSGEILVRGVAEKDSSLTINGQEVLVKESGDFSEQVQVSPGWNSFTVRTVNKFKKENSLTFSVHAEY